MQNTQSSVIVLLYLFLFFLFMGLFDGIIGAETPVSNIGDSMTSPVSGGSGSSGGSTSDDGIMPVATEQTTPPLIIQTDTE